MLIVLIGPKGSGKSHIGRLLEKEFGVHFLDVEPHWLAFHNECREEGVEPDIAEGISRIHPLIESALGAHNAVCVETTGASRDILSDLMSFGDRTALILVGVRAPLDICLERIASRDQSVHIPHSVQEIRRVYEQSSAPDIPLDLVIDNTNITDNDIVRIVRQTLDGA